MRGGCLQAVPNIVIWHNFAEKRWSQPEVWLYIAFPVHECKHWLTTPPSSEDVQQCCGKGKMHCVTKNASLHCSDHIPRVTRKQQLSAHLSLWVETLWLDGLTTAFEFFCLNSKLTTASLNGGWVKHPGAATIGSQLLDRDWSHDWQILETKPWVPRQKERQAPSHWINSGKREAREGEHLRMFSHANQHSL